LCPKFGTTSIGEDITERKQMENELSAVNKDLLGINRIITSITGLSNINEILEKELGARI